MIAKQLLTDDGVVFISIDDNEVENLIKVGNLVFGDNNFINVVTVKTKVGGVSGSSEGKSLKDATEFICIWAKNKSEVMFNPVYLKTKLFDRIKSYEIEGKSWKYTSIVTELSEKVLLRNDEKNRMKFYGYRVLKTQSIISYAKENNICQSCKSVLYIATNSTRTSLYIGQQPELKTNSYARMILFSLR